MEREHSGLEAEPLEVHLVETVGSEGDLPKEEDGNEKGNKAEG